MQSSRDLTLIAINQGVVIDALLPLPPVAEQRVIVERIDKIMAIIDNFEKQVTERKEQSEQLMQSVLSETFNSCSEETKAG